MTAWWTDGEHEDMAEDEAPDWYDLPFYATLLLAEEMEKEITRDRYGSFKVRLCKIPALLNLSSNPLAAPAVFYLTGRRFGFTRKESCTLLTLKYALHKDAIAVQKSY